MRRISTSFCEKMPVPYVKWRAKWNSEVGMDIFKRNWEIWNKNHFGDRMCIFWSKDLWIWAFLWRTGPWFSETLHKKVKDKLNLVDNLRKVYLMMLSWLKGCERRWCLICFVKSTLELRENQDLICKWSKCHFSKSNFLWNWIGKKSVNPSIIVLDLFWNFIKHTKCDRNARNFLKNSNV